MGEIIDDRLKRRGPRMLPWGSPDSRGTEQASIVKLDQIQQLKHQISPQIPAVQSLMRHLS